MSIATHPCIICSTTLVAKSTLFMRSGWRTWWMRHGTCSSPIRFQTANNLTQTAAKALVARSTPLVTKTTVIVGTIGRTARGNCARSTIVRLCLPLPTDGTWKIDFRGPVITRMGFVANRNYLIKGLYDVHMDRLKRQKNEIISNFDCWSSNI